MQYCKQVPDSGVDATFFTLTHVTYEDRYPGIPYLHVQDQHNGMLYSVSVMLELPIKGGVFPVSAEIVEQISQQTDGNNSDQTAKTYQVTEYEGSDDGKLDCLEGIIQTIRERGIPQHV